MTGPMEPDAIGVFATRILRIPQGDPQPSAPFEFTVDGPLSHGLAGLHTLHAGLGQNFAQTADKGIVETGRILEQVSADFPAIDSKGAAGMRMLLDDPATRTAPAADAGAEPEVP